MRKALRILIPVLAGGILGAAPVLLWKPPRRQPPPVPAEPFSESLPGPVEGSAAVPVELFGFPCPTPDEAPSSGARAGIPRRYRPVPGRCVAGFDASSTLHDFRGWTRAVVGEIRFSADRPEETPTAVIRVDARTLDTGDPDRDAEMHRHLEDQSIPEIVFTMDRLRTEGSSRRRGSFVVGGILQVRDRKVSVESPGTFEVRSDGYLHAKGEFRVKLTQFGIDPPTTAMVIRVADEIKIWFDLWAKVEEKGP